MRSAYRNVFIVWSAEEAPGETVAIIVVRASDDVKQSFKIKVNFEARYGTCFEDPLSNARIHSFKANKEVLISELSVRLWRLCDFVSEPRSLPARSTRDNLPLSFPVSLCLSIIWQIAWERDDVSFASVA